MKIYIVTEKKVGNLEVHEEYLDCFDNAEECLDFVSRMQGEGRDVTMITKEFGGYTIPRVPDSIGGPVYQKCRTFDDCMNPLHDCINCPVLGKSKELITTTDLTTEIYRGTTASSELDNKNIPF